MLTQRDRVLLQLGETPFCVLEAVRLALTSSCKICGWIIEKGKAEHLNRGGTFGRLDGQTHIAAGQQRKAIAIAAAHSATGSVSTLFGVHPRALTVTLHARGKHWDSFNEQVEVHPKCEFQNLVSQLHKRD